MDKMLFVFCRSLELFFWETKQVENVKQWNVQNTIYWVSYDSMSLILI